MTTVDEAPDGYELIERLGRPGRQGEVFAAFDPQGLRRALKLLSAGDEHRRQRFAREAYAAYRLNHPHIARVCDYDVEAAHPWIATELIVGDSLDAVAPVTDLDRYLSHSVALSSALQTVHSAGIAHRDLKPANVMVDADGTLKLIDFGIALTDGPHRDHDAGDRTPRPGGGCGGGCGRARRALLRHGPSGGNAVTGTAKLVWLRVRELVHTAVVASRGIDREAVLRACARVLDSRALRWSEHTVMWPQTLVVYMPADYLDGFSTQEQQRIETDLAATLAQRCRIDDAAPQVIVYLAADPSLTRTLRVCAHTDVRDRADIELVGAASPPDPLAAFGRSLDDGGQPTSPMPAEERTDSEDPRPVEDDEAGPTPGEAPDVAADGAGERTQPAPPPGALTVWRADGVRVPVDEADADGLVVGRDGEGPCRLTDERVSARHCRLWYRDATGTLWVEDLGSRNGTWVNDKRIDRPTQLVIGDDLRAGGVRFSVVDGSRGGQSRAPGDGDAG